MKLADFSLREQEDNSKYMMDICLLTSLLNKTKIDDFVIPPVQQSITMHMCIWMHPYNIMAALLHQAFGSHLEFWVTPGQQIVVKCLL